ncbi:MAG: hypothetical protein WBB28_07060 [Crinalium sp.]
MNADVDQDFVLSALATAISLVCHSGDIKIAFKICFAYRVSIQAIINYQDNYFELMLGNNRAMAYYQRVIGSQNNNFFPRVTN